VASLAGFGVSIIDDREAYASRERFPEARQIFAGDFDAALAKLDIPEHAYIVIVTRGHRDDMRVLRWAIDQPAKYLGMIGSKRKVLSIYKELEKEGVAPSKFERINAPIGLEIGAVTPEEIAVAIVAEMIAVRRKVDVEALSKSKPIQDRIS
jgi:xanthine dehydrogenase accessory factor